MQLVVLVVGLHSNRMEAGPVRQSKAEHKAGVESAWPEIVTADRLHFSETARRESIR